MSYTFNAATPVQMKRAGREAQPNPFTDVIATIALKVDEKTTKPVAMSFIETHPEGGRDKAVARVKRLLSTAGEQNDPPVTVRVDATPVMIPAKGKDAEKASDTETTILFWTTKRQIRTRTASTDQSIATSTPAV